MGRIAPLAIAAGMLLATLAVDPGAAAKPRKPPKPKVELRTETQHGALRKQAIEARVSSKRGKAARVKGLLVVHGYPEPYRLKLRRERTRLRGGRGTATLELSRRHREVLAFGRQACWRAIVKLKARAGGRTDRSSDSLRRPRGC